MQAPKPALQQEVDAIFSQADAARDPAFKDAHPIQPFHEIEQAYPDHWIALTVTAVDATPQSIAAGRIVAAAPTLAELHEQVQHVLQLYPDLGITECFTGFYGVSDR